jgi:hypothetical protein
MEYTVTKASRLYTQVRVEAESPEEARARVEEGEGEFVDSYVDDFEEVIDAKGEDGVLYIFEGGELQDTVGGEGVE